MNELSLSNDLKQIELEINHHKQIAGQSIWEIGRRLNHVKENDLAHGEFRSWHESIGINKDFASQSMKVSKELKNVDTFRHLGVRALYLITSIPEEERQKEHITENGQLKTPDQMTVKELNKLKKKLQQKDEEIKTLRSRDPEVVEKEIIKEVKVTPADYEGMKSDIKELSKALRVTQAELNYAKSEAEAATDRNKFIEKQHSEMLNNRKVVNEQAQEYQDLKDSVARMQGKLDKQQKELKALKRITQLVKQSNEFLYQIAPIKYYEEFEILRTNYNVQEEVIELVERTEQWCSEMRQLLNTNILEGEIIND